MVPGDGAMWPSIIALIASFAYGVLFTMRVGGADMPITVSLLNSLSGVAASVSALHCNPLLVARAVVGASTDPHADNVQSDEQELQVLTARPL